MEPYHDYIVWNECHIALLDIRLHILAQGEEKQGYRLPAGTFLFVYRGKATLKIDNQLIAVNRCFIFHGCPGMKLDIRADEELEYYLILYRSELPIRRKFLLGKDKALPDRQTFSFMPAQPMLLYPFLFRMEEIWRRSTGREKLEVKTLFYSFIFEMLEQKQQQEHEKPPEEVVNRIIGYIQHNLEESMTLESLGQKFGYNGQYLARKFKEKTGRSPIEFLIGLRIERACHLLRHTDAAIGEIARRVGYEDLFYFNRIFKKNTGLSPSHYKKEDRNRTHLRFSPYKKSRSSMVKQSSLDYSDIDNHYQYLREGEFSMRKGSGPSLAATVLMGLSLLLSACGGGALPNSSGAAAAPSAEAVQSAANTDSGGAGASSVQEALPASKTVNTFFGDVEIPAKAKRIVAIQYLSSILAVKAAPIASTTRILENPYFAGLTDQIEVVGASGSDISLEKLVEIEPDLIVVMTSSKEDYEMFSKIAPTIGIPYGSFESIEEEVDFFGNLLGREAEAAEWLSDYQSRITEARKRVEAVIPTGATFTVMEETDKTLSVFGPHFGRGGQAIYENLGRTAPLYDWDYLNKEKYRQISKEVLADYEADYLVLTTEKSRDEIRRDTFWGRLDAVRNDRFYVWSNNRSYFIDPLSVLRQTEELADWLTGLNNGYGKQDKAAPDPRG